MPVVLLFAAVLTLGYASAGSYPGGTASPFINQTGEGSYTMYNVPTAAGPQNITLHSLWYQDDLAKRLHITVGRPYTSEWQVSFWFLKNATYEERPQGSNRTAHCKKFTDFTYGREIGAYGPKYLSFVNKATLHEKEGDVVVDMYAGQVLDGVGPLNVVVSVDMNGLYTKMLTIGALGSMHYSEYYINKRNNSIPDSRFFKLPASCDHPEMLRFDDMFDRYGKKINKPSPLPSRGAAPVTAHVIGVTSLVTVVTTMLLRK